jgi:hypothetical protein
MSYTSPFIPLDFNKKLMREDIFHSQGQIQEGKDKKDGEEKMEKPLFITLRGTNGVCSRKKRMEVYTWCNRT